MTSSKFLSDDNKYFSGIPRGINDPKASGILKEWEGVEEKEYCHGHCLQDDTKYKRPTTSDNRSGTQ